MTVPSQAEAAASDWQNCRIGSCQRHRECMYKPCRTTQATQMGASVEDEAWNLLCARLQRDPASSEESDTCTLRAAWKAMLAFAKPTPPASVSGGAPSREGRSVGIGREMTAELDRRRVLTLARLLPMLSLMAGGEALEVDGFDPAELHAEVLMALGIEDDDSPETMAEVIVEMDGKSGHGILDRATKATQAVGAEPFGYWVEQRYAEPVLLRKPAYIPDPNENRTVTPLYTAPASPSPSGEEVERLREARFLGDIRESFERIGKAGFSEELLVHADEAAALVGLIDAALYPNKDSPDE